MWWEQGWVWIVAGIALGVLEVIAPSYLFLGFAIGASVVGILLWTGLLAVNWPALVLIFAVLSLVSWALLRRLFGVRKGQVKIWEKDVND